ncbi:MAG TPA: hypothetical protein VN081_06955 [Dongiaceae bacterium]|nr:hypothetical protein [Dongiaceae bacterium]
MKSFRDHATDILTAYGYASSNGDDLARDEPEDFNLEPGRWQLVGDAWQPYIDTRAEIQAQIDQLERESLMNRGSRELAMRQIEERAQLDATAENTAEQILAAQPFYARLKQVDDQVSALRVQL